MVRKKSPAQLQREIDAALASPKLDRLLDRAAAGREVTIDARDLAPAVVESVYAAAKARGLHASGTRQWILIRPPLRYAHSTVKGASSPTMRYLYVVTVHNNKGTKLAELTGRRDDRGNAEVRLWNASQRRWQKDNVLLDYEHGYFVDDRPASAADLKRYGFKLPAGHYLG